MMKFSQPMLLHSHMNLILAQRRPFSYIVSSGLTPDNSISEGIYVEEEMDVIAKSPYILIEEPEVEVMNAHTDDVLFEILTRCRTTE